VIEKDVAVEQVEGDSSQEKTDVNGKETREIAPATDESCTETPVTQLETEVNGDDLVVDEEVKEEESTEDHPAPVESLEASETPTGTSSAETVNLLT